MTPAGVVAGLLLGVVPVPPASGPPDVGPAIGAPLPAFEARDQDGRLRTFSDLKGPSGLILIFYRSADW
jgi:hypothetical protein